MVRHYDPDDVRRFEQWLQTRHLDVEYQPPEVREEWWRSQLRAAYAWGYSDAERAARTPE